MQVERKLMFPEGRKLRIMQVSDVQDMHFIRPAAFKMLDAAYDRVKPDIIVFTGDNILGNHIDEFRFDKFRVKSKKAVAKNIKKALTYVLEPVEKRQIPFCMIYGNHDDKNLLSKEEQAEFYKEYSCFFGLSDPDEGLDCDTCNVPIYDSAGEKVIFNLWLLDSAGKDDGNGDPYQYVTPQTVEWYKKTSSKLREENGGKPVPSLMFQHVPVIQTKELFIECDPRDPDAVKFPSGDGLFYKLDLFKARGYAGEYPDTCSEDFGQLEAIREQGDVCAFVFGHDHSNSFEAEIGGVKIIQTPGASFRCYGTRESRGVRVFEIDEADPGNVSNYELGYFDLFGSTAKSEFDYFMSADEFDKKRLVSIGSAAAGAGILLGGKIIKNLIKGRKRK
ncbi:MAG: metallophosphoesterase [Clostridiales bacterium]|nr:metallophosphoesterase [Clostridiales bacterium]